MRSAAAAAAAGVTVFEGGIGAGGEKEEGVEVVEEHGGGRCMGA